MEDKKERAGKTCFSPMQRQSWTSERKRGNKRMMGEHEYKHVSFIEETKETEKKDKMTKMRQTRKQDIKQEIRKEINREVNRKKKEKKAEKQRKKK